MNEKMNTWMKKWKNEDMNENVNTRMKKWIHEWKSEYMDENLKGYEWANVIKGCKKGWMKR